MRFSWKVTLVTLCILVISFSAGSYLLVTLSFQSALEREVGVAQEEMQMLRISYEAVCAAKGVTLENIDTLGRRVTRTLEEDPFFENHQFQVTTGAGRPVYSALSAPSDRELLESVDELSTGYTIRRQSGGVFVHCAGAVSLTDGVLYLETVRDISSLFADRETHYQYYRYLLLAVAAVSGLALYLLSTWLTRPIRNLSRTAAALAAGDYAARAQVGSGDEIHDLADSFNRMADAIARNVGELEEARSRQEEFTASFVHELKTPLTSIIGYADMLRSRQLTPDMSFKAASYIFSEGKRLERLSLSLMDLLVAGHSAADKGPVAMAELCQSAARAAGPAMEKNGISLTVRAEAGTLEGDPALLQTLLLNLLDNARKASSPGGEVLLEGGPAETGYRLAVTDRGRGIPASELERITEPFYMVDKSRSRAEGGAGLGLALCKEIAAVHGGALRFTSQEGEGTTVEVTLEGSRHERA